MLCIGFLGLLCVLLDNYWLNLFCFFPLGYKLDESDPTGPVLKLQFARFSASERRGGHRDDFGGGRNNSFNRSQ